MRIVFFRPLLAVYLLLERLRVERVERVDLAGDLDATDLDFFRFVASGVLSSCTMLSSSFFAFLLGRGGFGNKPAPAFLVRFLVFGR